MSSTATPIIKPLRKLFLLLPEEEPEPEGDARGAVGVADGGAVFGAIVGATEMGSSLADVPGKVAKGSKVEELMACSVSGGIIVVKLLLSSVPSEIASVEVNLFSSGLTGIEDAEAAFSLLPH